MIDVLEVAVNVIWKLVDIPIAAPEEYIGVIRLLELGSLKRYGFSGEEVCNGVDPLFLLSIIKVIDGPYDALGVLLFAYDSGRFGLFEASVVMLLKQAIVLASEIRLVIKE